MKISDGNNMLMPALANRFIAEFAVTDLAAYELNALTRQVSNVKIDLINSTLTIELDQSIETELVGVIRRLLMKIKLFDSNEIRIALTQSDLSPYSRMIFGSLTATSHYFRMDYSVNSNMKHTLVFKFDSYRAEHYFEESSFK